MRRNLQCKNKNQHHLPETLSRPDGKDPSFRSNSSLNKHELPREGNPLQKFVDQTSCNGRSEGKVSLQSKRQFPFRLFPLLAGAGRGLSTTFQITMCKGPTHASKDLNGKSRTVLFRIALKPIPFSFSVSLLTTSNEHLMLEFWVSWLRDSLCALFLSLEIEYRFL